MRKRPRIAAADFQAIRHLLNISDDRIEAARLVLVEGKSLSSVAIDYNITKQAVHKSVKACQSMLEKYNEAQAISQKAAAIIPPGWEQALIVAPSDMIEKFKNEVASLTPPQTPRV